MNSYEPTVDIGIESQGLKERANPLLTYLVSIRDVYGLLADVSSGLTVIDYLADGFVLLKKAISLLKPQPMVEAVLLLPWLGQTNR